MADAAELEALLQRAVDIEVKTAAVTEQLAGRELTPDAREDLADQARERLEGEVDDELVADLEAGLAAVEAEWQTQFGDDDDDDPKGYDFDEVDLADPPDLDTKALGGCAKCGDTDVDVLAGGARQCSGCGWPVEAKAGDEVEHKDFDDPGDLEPAAAAGGDDFLDDAAVDALLAEAKADEAPVEAKSLLSETDLLRRERLALEQD